MSTNTSATPVEQARELIVRALEILSTVEPSKPKRQHPFDIVIDRVAEAFRVDRALIFSRLRTAEAARPRQVALYFCHQIDRDTLKIAKYFGRQRATVIWHLSTIEHHLQTDKKFRTCVESLSQELEALVSKTP
jgi:chromosomal replication initiation ATPase DnaA